MEFCYLLPPRPEASKRRQNQTRKIPPIGTLLCLISKIKSRLCTSFASLEQRNEPRDGVK